MKVILSRKGFDSVYGGFPSPILPNGMMISLPIPSEESHIKYKELKVDRFTLLDVIRQLKGKVKVDGVWRVLEGNEDISCHLDPDIYKFLKKRPKSWKPLFGQVGAAQSHLENQGVGEGDIFLFFGWFRKAKFIGGKLVFDPRDYDKHVIFGYFQIGGVVRASGDFLSRVPEWMKYHPHFKEARLRRVRNNTVYVSRESLSWDDDLPGAGFFCYSHDLVLTKEGYSRSIWKLPSFFREVKITYHSRKSWRGDDTFKSAGRGQEFVIEENNKVGKWVRKLIENNYCSSPQLL